MVSFTSTIQAVLETLHAWNASIPAMQANISATGGGLPPRLSAVSARAQTLQQASLGVDVAAIVVESQSLDAYEVSPLFTLDAAKAPLVDGHEASANSLIAAAVAAAAAPLAPPAQTLLTQSLSLPSDDAAIRASLDNIDFGMREADYAGAGTQLKAVASSAKQTCTLISSVSIVNYQILLQLVQAYTDLYALTDRGTRVTNLGISVWDNAEHAVASTAQCTQSLAAADAEASTLRQHLTVLQARYADVTAQIAGIQADMNVARGNLTNISAELYSLPQCPN